MHLMCLDEMLPKEHRCRIVWQFVNSLNLDAFYQEIRSTLSAAGHPAIAPEILLTLWLQATLDGIGSAREIDRRCNTDIPYRWICGGVSVNDHTISDFRCGHSEKLDQILTDSVTSLIDKDLIDLNELAQDGMRVRAHAGSSSFRRKPSLKKLQEEARELVERLADERDKDEAPQADARRKAARKRAAEDRQQRIDEALQLNERLTQERQEKHKDPDKKRIEGDKVRTSTTDPEARRMKMGDGGTRPAYNVQFSSDSGGRVIVGVEVNNHGTDGGELVPMLDQVEDRYGKRPDRVLVDSAYATKDGVEQTEKRGTEVISTVPRSEQLRRHGKDPHTKQRGDSDEYEAFRIRMAAESYQELYRKRPSVAEFPNAVCRNHGLGQFLVRGAVKAKCVALLHALAFNLQRMIHLEAT